MSAGKAIDHVVLGVRELDAAASVYQDLGFTLTPRAAHEDRMGTSNRLVQFAEQNFIELLEVDRPHTLAEHDFSAEPPTFGFGAYLRDQIAERDGIAMLVLISDDARADHAYWQSVGVPTYAPFDFQRAAKLPDGSSVTVSFSLTFATSPDMPGVAFFVCQNRAKEHFWKPAFQRHDNAAQGIRGVYLASPEPYRDAEFMARLSGGAASEVDGGFSVACGTDQAVLVLQPEAIRERDRSYAVSERRGAQLAGLRLRSDVARETTPAAAACGAFLEWA